MKHIISLSLLTLVQRVVKVNVNQGMLNSVCSMLLMKIWKWNKTDLIAEVLSGQLRYG